MNSSLELKELCLFAGINVNAFERMQSHEGHSQIDGYLALQDACYKLHAAYTVTNMTPEMWKNYDLMGVTGLPEQITLNKTKLTVRKIWNDYYRKVKESIAERYKGRAKGQHVQPPLTGYLDSDSGKLEPRVSDEASD